jgi:hypothetical protein
MLFIFVMDVLNSLVEYAARESLIQPLAVQQPWHWVSFFADDAVISLRPGRTDLQVIRSILDLFGHTSGLHTNLVKSSVSPIYCSGEDMLTTAEGLSCVVNR